MRIARLLFRAGPAGQPVMYQTWAKLLFLHWPVPEETLRPLLPRGLQLDSFAGRAWIGLIPFTMWGIRPFFLPALPLLSASHELNVRTYVRLDGVPGVWFFSLDAASPLVVWGGRTIFFLPYFRARMRLEQNGPVIHFRSRRRHPGTPPAEFEAAWTIGDPLPPGPPDSLECFLVERYCLYTERRGRLYRARIQHRPWRLHRATLSSFRSTLIEADGLPSPAGPPLLHALAQPLPVQLWPLEPV